MYYSIGMNYGSFEADLGKLQSGIIEIAKYLNEKDEPYIYEIENIYFNGELALSEQAVAEANQLFKDHLLTETEIEEDKRFNSGLLTWLQAQQL